MSHIETLGQLADARAEIARLTTELAAARAVPADVEDRIVLLRRAAVRAGRTYATGSTGDGMASDDEVDHEIAALKAAIARAIAEARQPATVGGLLATAPVGSIVEYQRDGGGRFAQVRKVDDWHTESRAWADEWWWPWSLPASMVLSSTISKPARLVPASEADADPATRGAICAPAMATTVRCGVCAKPTANKNHEPGGDEQPTCDRCMDATRGPLPKGG